MYEEQMCKEPKISEVLIHMDAFLKSTKTNGKKKVVSEIFFNHYQVTIVSKLFKQIFLYSIFQTNFCFKEHYLKEV